MNDKTTLCTHCRSEFTDAEIEGASACPICGTRGVPADLRKKHIIALTDHEWRIVFMWADRWAGTIKDDAGSAQACINGIINEVRKQAPDMPSLTLRGEIQDLANATGSRIEKVGEGGEEIYEPEKKH